MPVEIPGCCDTEWELLRKILLSLDDIGGGGGGDVVGPVGAVSGDLAIFNGNTGLIISDSGILASSIVTTSTLQSGSQAIGAGVDTISVVFATPFAAIPTVIESISRPVAENMIYANIDEASITVNGFTASLSAATGSANYKLKWMAK